MPQFAFGVNLFPHLTACLISIERNCEFVAGDLFVGDGVDRAHLYLGFDAQTSGGLLMAVPKHLLDKLLVALGEAGELAFHIGEVTTASDGFIELVNNSSSQDDFSVSQKALVNNSLPV